MKTDNLQTELTSINAFPAPLINENPAMYSDRLGKWYASQTSSIHRKTLGQFMTPLGVASYMAKMVTISVDSIFILDPGAGAGILVCAVCEYLCNRIKKPKNIHITAYEIDANVITILEKALSYLASFMIQRGIELHFEIEHNDFIVSNAHAMNQNQALFDGKSFRHFDLIIANPPYFKLSKTDPRAKATEMVVHGQPNIYCLFMAVATSLLEDNGKLIFIIPRSFASGTYFRRFREYFFRKMTPERIHIFNSRRHAFKDSGVLQESIILAARKDEGWLSIAHKQKGAVTVSVSNGSDDIRESDMVDFPIRSILSNNSSGFYLRIPNNQEEENRLDAIHSWKATLESLGFQISTGPVVPFRAKQFIYGTTPNGIEVVPLLWMQNVNAMKLTWPCAKNGKPQFIEYSSKSVKLLVPAGNYVLLRRFSAKEDKHRLIAAPINREHVKGVYIGIENHLNYIWQPRGKMSEAEAWGLAGIFNSGFYERYFRAINGNTQVNASEIRSMPLPPIQIIRNIGEQILQLLPAHDKILMFVRSLDQILAPRLEEGENEKT